MHKYKLHLLLMLCFFFYHGTNAEKCKKLFNELADQQSKFALCVVRHSSPEATYCENCIDYYKNLTNDYKELISNTTCTKEYINRNRLNVAYNMQNYLLDIWNKGFCDNCFDGGALSIETMQFSNSSIELGNCLNGTKTKNTDPCALCNGTYSDLNDIYTKLDKKYKGQVCFDVQDQMNRTRLHWSKDLNCCHRQYSLTLFFIASSLFTALPVVFYFGMFGYAKHMERNHEVLDADLNAEHASTSSGVQVGRSTTVAERPTTSNRSSNFEDIDKLKSKISSTKRPSDEPVIKTIAPEPAHSSNDNPRLIEL